MGPKKYAIKREETKKTERIKVTESTDGNRVKKVWFGRKKCEAKCVKAKLLSRTEK